MKFKKTGLTANNLAQKLVALINGNILKVYNHEYVFGIYLRIKNENLEVLEVCNNCYSEWKISSFSFAFIRDETENFVYEEKHWYDDIPEKGILCWVNKEKTCIANIKKYNSETNKFECPYASFIYATPLSEDEAMELIYE